MAIRRPIRLPKQCPAHVKSGLLHGGRRMTRMRHDEDRTLKLSDGRALGYSEYGEAAGKPLLHFHGHPGSRLEGALMHETAVRRGVRLIVPDRPGIGLSDFKPGRRLLDWPDDVVELANSLKLDRFAVVGVSGGGPYAIVCAYGIPERLTACGIIAGVGPIVRFGTRGMMMANRIQFTIAPHLPWLLRTALWAMFGRRRKLLNDRERLRRAALRMVTGLPRPDREAVTDPAIAEAYLRETLEAFRCGSRGPTHDAVLYSTPWEFELEDVAFENVHLWHGHLDVNVPIRMGRAVAEAIPGCRARFYPEEAHLSLAIRRLDEVFGTLTAGDTRDSSIGSDGGRRSS